MKTHYFTAAVAALALSYCASARPIVQDSSSKHSLSQNDSLDTIVTVQEIPESRFRHLSCNEGKESMMLVQHIQRGRIVLFSIPRYIKTCKMNEETYHLIDIQRDGSIDYVVEPLDGLYRGKPQGKKVSFQNYTTEEQSDLKAAFRDPI